jgi:aminopeptidase
MYKLSHSKEYASILLKGSLNIQKDDFLIIFAPLEHQDFASLCKEEAKKMGAKEIKIFYNDDHEEFTSYESNSKDYVWLNEEDFEYIDNAIINENARLLYLRSIMYNFFEKLPKEALNLRMSSFLKSFSRIYHYAIHNKVAYCLACLPNNTWAKALYPDFDEDTAFEKLWEKMMIAMYMDKQNPTQSWKDRALILQERQNIMMRKKFKAINFEGEGTDLTLELPDSQSWTGGIMIAPDGRKFIPNIPTEEVFTAPIRTGVHGKLTSRYPRYLEKQILNEYTLEFENGRCMGFTSNENQRLADILYAHCSYPENADYLGEIALVSSDSGVFESKTQFIDALLDENAACHIAFGNAYRFSFLGGIEMNDEEFMAVGGNISDAHRDMSFDSNNMLVYGINPDSTKELILDYGVWVLK